MEDKWPAFTYANIFGKHQQFGCKRDVVGHIVEDIRPVEPSRPVGRRRISRWTVERICEDIRPNFHSDVLLRELHRVPELVRRRLNWYQSPRVALNALLARANVGDARY